MNSTVIVTGTSTGIGRACVQRLAASGWTVFAGIRRPADADALVAECDGDVHPLLMDITDPEHIERAVAEITSAVGPAGLDGLVNNAGLGLGGPVELVTLDDWRLQFEVNLFGQLALTRAVFELVRSAGGRFVFIGSDAGRVSTPGTAPYSASKHALEAVCESMRHELASSPMRVCLVEPGMVKTAIWDKTSSELERVERLMPEQRMDDYGFLIPATRGFVAEGASKGIAPEKIAAVVEQALTASRPKARYLVGPDAKVLGHVVNRLPDRARDLVIGAMVRRMIKNGSKSEPAGDAA